MKIEEWRFISGYEGIYMVSNWGRVKSINYRRSGKERILKLSKNSEGYLNVQLFKDGIRKAFSIHTLVWDAFGDSPRNGHILQIDHINNDKTDNRIENLQLLSNRDNCSKRSLEKKEKTSKFTGVYWYKQRNKWVSQITINKKHHTIGYFNTQEAASQAYLKAKENLK